MTEATASTPRTSSHHRSMTGPVGISTSNYKSLNDKISHIESMLRRIQQEEDEDNDQLVKLMEKSEQLQQKAHRHIERCGSMKTILVAPRAQETVRPVAQSPDKLNQTVVVEPERVLRRVHSMQKYEPMEKIMSPFLVKTEVKREKNSSRLNFLSKYIDVALGELDASRMSVSVGPSRLPSEQNLRTEEISPEKVCRMPQSKGLRSATKQEQAPATLQNIESKFKMLLGVFTSFALMISMI